MSLTHTKRLRLSQTGEIRALTRILERRAPEAERATWRRTRHLVERIEMEAQAVELNAAMIAVRTTIFGETTNQVNVDEETARVIYAHAWAELERHLVDANATYSQDQDDPFNRASNLRDSLESARRYAEVIYTLTAVPMDEPEPDE